MKKKIKKILVILIAILIIIPSCVSYFLYSKNKSLEQDLIISQNNVSALKEGQIKYKTKDSLNAIQINALQLSNRELKEENIKQYTEIKNLKDSKHKSTEYITKFDIKYVDRFIIDTAYVYKDSCRSYTNGYTTLDICKNNATITNRDTISQVISKHYKYKFLWFKFKNDGITQDIYNKNPNSTIVFEKFIKIK